MDTPSSCERLRSGIERALAFAGGSHTFDDIRAAVASHRMQLWECGESFIITEVGTYPRYKVVTMVVAGGRLDELVQAYPLVIEWAKAQGCQRVQMIGKHGYWRVWKQLGFEIAGTIFEKRLTDGEELPGGHDDNARPDD